MIEPAPASAAPITTVFIMCQGQQRRLAKLGYPKQLALVGDEPILHRTLRLLLPFEVSPVVVGSPALIDQARLIAGLTLKDPGYCIIDGMERALAEMPTAPAGRLVFLLGDVLWSRAALSALMTDQRPVVFAGTELLDKSGGELFGCAFAPEAVATLKKHLSEAPCRYAVGTGRRQPIRFSAMQGGHLRRLLWQYMVDTPQAQLPGQRKKWLPALYLPVTDFTDDIDDAGDLARLSEVAQKILAEGSEPSKLPS